MLTYLTGSVRPDIAMAVHQCAQFSANPMRSHEQAVMRIGQYLLSTQDRGMTYTPDPTKGIKVYVDADFAGGWDPGDARNADNVYSQLDMLFGMLGVLSIGRANFKRRFHYQRLKQSTLHYLRL